jgi:hypothetical protein
VEPWEKVFEQLKIKLVPAKAGVTLEQRIKKSRLKHPECLRILSNFNLFLDVIPAGTERKELLQQVNFILYPFIFILFIFILFYFIFSYFKLTLVLNPKC